MGRRVNMVLLMTLAAGTNAQEGTLAQETPDEGLLEFLGTFGDAEGNFVDPLDVIEADEQAEEARNEAQE